jgi:hypothetical protein
MNKLCQHPIMRRVKEACCARARFRITISGIAAHLTLHGHSVHLVCGRHANSVSSACPGAWLEDIENG